MIPIRAKDKQSLSTSLAIEPAEPLWKRAPREDENGRPLGDFMMILPKLRKKPQHFIQETLQKIEKVLAAYSNVVVFADFNMRLNVLCVIVKQQPGICWELPCAINALVPEALLVAQPSFN